MPWLPWRGHRTIETNKENKMENETQGSEFIKHLHAEKLKAQEWRTTYTLRKLAYATALLGIGSLQINIGSISTAGEINLGLVLYLAPWVALAFDLYVLGEDYSVKRFGKFLQESSPDDLERKWEKWVSQRRDPFAPFAMPILTTLLLLGAAVIIWIGGTARGQFYWWWLILTALLNWGLFFLYRQLLSRPAQGAKETRDDQAATL